MGRSSQPMGVGISGQVDRSCGREEKLGLVFHRSTSGKANPTPLIPSRLATLGGQDPGSQTVLNPTQVGTSSSTKVLKEGLLGNSAN